MNAAPDILSRFEGVKRSGAGWMVKCPVPAHDDHRASLSICLTADDKILMHCQAGCHTEEILRVTGLTWADLMPSNGRDRGHANKGRPIAEYEYCDESGAVLYQKQRFHPRTFCFRRRDLKLPDGWVSGPGCMTGVHRVLFRLPDVLAAIGRGEEIIVVEGEKDALNTGKLGFVATTWDGGATTGDMSHKWLPEFTTTLAKAARVVIFRDNDAAGHHSGEYIATELVKAGCLAVRIVDIPSLAESEDISDHIARGGTTEDIRKLIAAAPIWKPSGAVPVVVGTLDEFKATQLTELATANRLKKHQGKNLRHHSGLGWLTWDRRRWKRGDKAAIRAAQAMGDVVRKELSSLGAVSADTAKAFYQHARDCERAAGVTNILQHARALEGIDADDVEFDQDVWALNCTNGTLDLRTGELRPHRREDHITALCPTPYDPNATAPRWERFLDEVFDEDADLKDYLQWAAGLSLSGCTEHDVFYITHGNGSNGKSTFLNTLLHVLGGDYAQQLDPETLLQQRHAQHSTELAMLRGVRLAVAIETGQGRRLNEPLIKALCGGDRMRARYMFHDSFEFTPSLKLFIGTNHAPNVRDDSTAMWRRVRLVPFTRQFLGDDADPNIEQKLRLEAPGILAWAVRGIVERYEREPEVPQAVKAATQAYREEQDVLAAFVRDECEAGPMHSVSIKRLYAAYVCFTGGHCESKRAFCDRIRAVGFETDKAYGERTFKGISLIEKDLLHGVD